MASLQGDHVAVLEGGATLPDVQNLCCRWYNSSKPLFSATITLVLKLWGLLGFYKYA